MTILRRLVDLLLSLMVALVVVLGAGASLGPAVGLDLYAVRTGSMAPSIPVGSLLVVMDTPPDQVRAGDVVTVRVGSGTTVTHRVADVVVQDDRRMYRLKGDANDAPDPVLVLPEQIVGRVAINVPLAGFFLALLTMPSGIAALLSCGALLLTVAFFLGDRRSPDAADERNPHGQTNVFRATPLP